MASFVLSLLARNSGGCLYNERTMDHTWGISTRYLGSFKDKISGNA